MSKPSVWPIAICVLDTALSQWSEPWDRALISDRATELGYKVPRVIDLAHANVETLVGECTSAEARAVVVPSLDHLPPAAAEALAAVNVKVVTVYPEIAPNAGAEQAGREQTLSTSDEKGSR
ncbi:hypothetical protein ACFWVM_29085 [Nocardia fluminea]|uniref:hypothetical protein n=1 Tax=Nocardia fluminea TaxID=134984 RepID=UPI003656A1E0